MPPKRRQRLLFVLLLTVFLALGLGLILYGFRQNLHLYLTPSLLAQESIKPGRVFRLGGLVQEGSLKRQGLDLSFTVTDLSHSTPVLYHGIVPDLFKEKGGVIAEGSLNAEGVFVARSILAKHDENYRPPKIQNQKK